MDIDKTETDSFGNNNDDDNNNDNLEENNNDNNNNNNTNNSESISESNVSEFLSLIEPLESKLNQKIELSLPVNNEIPKVEECKDSDEKLIEIESSEIEPNSEAGKVETETGSDKRSTDEPNPAPTDSASIAAQFNKIVRLRKTTVPRCRRSELPSKATPRYMTQPVSSENQLSFESLRDLGDGENSSSTNSVPQDTSVSNLVPERKNTDISEKILPTKYSRTLSGTTKIKREPAEISDFANSSSYLLSLGKKKDNSDIDNKSDRSQGSQELSISPENSSSHLFQDELKKQPNKSSQTSLPGSLRRNAPHHIRIHSDEIKPRCDAIADVTSEYLNRKISKTDKKEMDFPFSGSAITNRISPFRYGTEMSPLDSVVYKSPSAHALMKSNIARNRNVKLSNPLIDNPENFREDYEETEVKPEEEEAGLEEKATEETETENQQSNEKLKKRYLIIQELISVESEYVKVLEILVNHYMIPLKLEKIVDEGHIDSIFNKIPELLSHHATFLGTLQSLEPDDTVGDKMSDMFSQFSIQECYASFIENFSVAEKILENVSNSKSMFQKFVEQKQKETKNKLPLKALLVQPVQRIPRYELLIKRLIEYTPQDSTDYDFLLDAQASIHQVALKINAVNESKQDESINEGLKLLDRLLSPMTINPNRQFIRHDIINMEDRKETYVIFLFTDQIILTTKKRGNPATKKPPVLRLSTPNGIDFIDNIKFKFISRINIENIEFESNEDTDQKFLQRNKEMKDKRDLSILEEIESLVSKLDRKHHELDTCIKKMYTGIIQDMEEIKNSKSMTAASQNIAACQFLITSKEGLERMEFIFTSPEKKQSWEKTVLEIKNKLVDVPRTPKFSESLSVTRTQSGMQFCCSCPIEGYNNSGIRDVWICQSDGFTGHLCLLSMQKDPIVTMNNPLPGCNAKVTCIIAVPGYFGTARRSSLNLESRLSAISLKMKAKQSAQKLEIPLETHEDESEIELEAVTLKPPQDESSSQSCSESDNEDIDETGVEDTSKSKKMNDPYKATMWIGLDDGSILVFYSAENVRTTKSKRKIELGSSVLSMLHFDNHIYVSLLNGEIVTFKRHLDGYWDFDYPSITKITSQNTPIKNLLAVTGFIWGTSGRNIIVINPTSIKIENTFSLVEGCDQRSISLIACSGQCVWLSQENSSRIMLYHAASYEFLYEVNIRPTVMQNLQVWDDIIIRHKEACLRITCFLVCKDLLWVGTSSGLILTIMIPNVTTITTKANICQPRVETLDKGHTGPVRFLVSLESSAKPMYHSARRQSLSPCTTMATQMKVICGGEGFEDFTNKNKESNPNIGKDDATNHILIWDIQ